LACGPDLSPYVEREAARVALERRQFEVTIAEIEARLGKGRLRAADLRSVTDLRALADKDPVLLSFEEQRLALRALGVRVYANGGDTALWRCEMSVPVGVRWGE
jgi:hypothetical protein